MAMRIALTPAAEADLEQIGDYIARDDPRRAVTFVGEIEARIAKISNLPKAGRLRPEWGADVRSTPFGNYLIVWRLRGDVLQILRVIHGARDLDALFEAEPLG
jgi:toxin ParE1/3/4